LAFSWLSLRSASSRLSAAESERGGKLILEDVDFGLGRGPGQFQLGVGCPGGRLQGLFRRL